jgi:hypothetical protein
MTSSQKGKKWTIPLAALNRFVFHQDGAIPRNARMNFVFLNHLNHFGER